MTIKYDFKGKYKKYYNEANGIYLLKKKLKKHTNSKTTGYIQCMLLRFFVAFIIVVILAILCTIMDLENALDLIRYLSKYVICIYVIIIMIYILLLSNYKIGSQRGILEINEKGITDKPDNGIEYKFPYEQIELIVITNDIITFITKIPIILFIKNENIDENKFISELEEYSGVPIINKTKRKSN